MKVIIDISKDIYEECRGHIYFPDTGGELFDAVKNGTPLDGTTNGEVMQTLFPKCVLSIDEDGWRTTNIDGYTEFTPEWWNAPYQKGE